ncbi:hypothetical protein XENTR_v10007083 [Xenopus tropicalis]|nr:hypothetical protein XENTR_v10007083 [Xenopus tropicalis]
MHLRNSGFRRSTPDSTKPYNNLAANGGGMGAHTGVLNTIFGPLHNILVPLAALCVGFLMNNSIF